MTQAAASEEDTARRQAVIRAVLEPALKTAPAHGGPARA